MDILPSIRQATLNDQAKLREIVSLSFPRFFRFFAIHSLHEEGHVLVAEVQGMIVGFAKLIDFQLGSEKFGCVLWLAVDPQFRRKGIAGALVRAGVERLKNGDARAVFASVSRRNFASLLVFRQQSFVRVGFLSLWRIFGWRVFGFYRDIWFAPLEIVLMHK